jgi:hypothetical protein
MAALIVTAAMIGLRSTSTVDSDVAWQLWIGGRLATGAHLYRDIIEVNPPLWFWLARPIDALAGLIGARPEPVLVVMMGVLVALSLAATEQLLSSLPVTQRRLMLVYAAATLIVLPWVHVGQREQIVLVTTMPYAVLIARRRQGKHIPVLLSAAIGTGAALGFALKPYFLFTPVTLELWLLVGRPSRWRIVRPETIVIALVGLLYLCAMLLWTSAYFTEIIPLAARAYGAIGAHTLMDLFGPSALVGLVILGFLATQWRPLLQGEAPIAAALFICAAAFAAAYVIQRKGWPYQAIPLVGCASLSLAAMLAQSRSLPSFVRIVSPAILALPLVLGIQEARLTGVTRTAAETAVAGLKSGDSVGFLTTDNALPWSVTLQHGFRFPSRYMSFWMLNAVVQNEVTGIPNRKLQDLGRLVVSQTVQDFRCAPPRRLIVAPPQMNGNSFDILAFFLRDPEFRAFMSQYKPRASRNLQTFDRVGPLPVIPSPCRARA